MDRRSGEYLKILEIIIKKSYVSAKTYIISNISTDATKWFHRGVIIVFSSPEPKAPGELIVKAGSVVRLSSVHNFKRLLP